ncbi:Subtilase family protein [Raphanus sativus]|nr:Subtilase family protein [Raphanus sativus]
MEQDTTHPETLGTLAATVRTPHLSRLETQSGTASSSLGSAMDDESAVPASRIAAYRVCAGECRDDVYCSAFDDAIADGVDIITISVGSIDVYPLEEDPIAIGAFHAMSRGDTHCERGGDTGPK